ncbi:AAA family ATPase [Corallococcus sp. AB038B]|uniref:AAA family ATPase n=1 Tax=Corallococcus sp. AB038B TaxID=2316718 RepID=UPI000EDCD697|nr:AAA family ATPase [Corallococcus sp. AB038B]RKH95288.1 hypothetical protein D7Y04_33845 [Corallococcus sp. AB038B]
MSKTETSVPTMHKLKAIRFTGYRSFANKTTLELRPLTLIYGRNNAGKSALLRLLPILADSVSDRAESPLDLSGPAARGATFLDILWRGQLPDSKKLTLELEWASDDSTTTDSYTLDHSDKIGTYVRKYTNSDKNNQTKLTLDAVAFGEEEKYTVIKKDTIQGEMKISFTGLIPSSPQPIAELKELTERLKSLRNQVQWLESVRIPPERIIRKPGGTPRVLSPNGKRAAEATLASNFIFSELQSWYSSPEIKRTLEAKEILNPMYRIFLNPKEGPCRDIDISDTGEGMVQVFPVLVAAALARQVGSTAFLAVEEPESHLHANAQKALAAYFSQIAASATAPTVIIETHSRMLLLGIQLAIARGLPPEKACAYWVDQEEGGHSVATLGEFDTSGGLSNWPSSAFAEDQSLARELLAEQLSTKE